MLTRQQLQTSQVSVIVNGAPNGYFRGVPQKNYMLGGIVLCVFPVIVFIAKHYDVAAGGKPLPIWAMALLVLFFLCGIYSIAAQLFKFAEDGVAHWFGGAFFTMAFGVFCLIVAWNAREGWTSSIPFLSEKMNSGIGRTLFAISGVGCQFLAVAFFRKAMRKYRAAYPHKESDNRGA